MTVAFLGLGGMGSRMARRLLDARDELVVWNRSAAKAEPLIAAGAHAASTPRDAASRAEVVVTMLSDGAALREVVEGGDGLGAGVQRGATVIEMSTVGPDAVAWLADALPDGVGLVDAPVLGSIGEAEGGTLRVFAGGDDQTVARVLPLLSLFGTPLHVGPVGSGAAAKLVANSTLFGSLGTLAEALVLAHALGLSRQSAFDVLAATPVAPQLERRRPALESGDYPVRFPLRLAAKDARLIGDAAAAAGLDLPLARAERERLAAALAAGLGDEDYSRILAWMLEGADARSSS